MLAKTSLSAYKSLSLAPILGHVLFVVDAAGELGLTCDEIAEKTGIEYRTVTPRIVQLERHGLVYRAGDTRKGLSGRAQLIVRASSHLATIPMIPKAKKRENPYLEGLKRAAKIILSQSDFESARKALKDELIKVASR